MSSICFLFDLKPEFHEFQSETEWIGLVSQNYHMTLEIIAYFIWKEQVEVIGIPLVVNVFFN